MVMWKRKSVDRSVWITASVLLTVGGWLHADLINHWKFNETNGVTVAADSVGSLPVTLHGNANFVADATRGQVLDLAGTVNDYADNPGEPFTIMIDHTVTVWVNHHDSGSFSGIWLSWGTLGVGRYFLGPYSGNGGKVIIGQALNTQFFSDPDAAPLLNTWEHWAYVREGSVLRLYRDGEIVQVVTNYNTSGVVGTDSGLQIGRSYDHLSPLDGRIDDLAIWDEALSQKEIQSAMALGAERYNDFMLINHWKFDETNGITAADSIGDLPVTLMNGASFVTDETRGQVLELDGVNDYATNSGEPFTNDMTHTVGLWAKHDDTPPFSAAWLTWGTSSPTYARYYLLPWSSTNPADSNNGKIVSGIGSDSMRRFTAASALPESGTWQYWTFVRDLQNLNIKLYLNGVLIQTLSTGNGAAISTNGVLRIGAGLSLDSPFDGRIDDIAIWNVALTPTEIRSAMMSGAENFKQPLPIPLELIHNWKFDESGAATEASDSEGNLPVTLQNGAVITTDSARGRVLELDGDNDYADNSGGIPLTIDMDHTVAVWVKHHESGSFDGIWLAWGVSPPTSRYFLGPHTVNSGKVTFGSGEDGYKTFSTSLAAPVQDTWQHWALVRDGIQARLYLNGILIQTITKDDGTLISLGSGLQIGRSYNVTANLDGRMDDLAIWQGALTDEQIQNVINYGAQYYLGPPAGTLFLVN